MVFSPIGLVWARCCHYILGVLALPGVFFLNSGFKMASKIERKEKVIAYSWNDIKGKFT